MIRMIVSDIDGTLIPIGSSMSKRTKKAILDCMERGVLFVPASGRTFYGAVRPFTELGIDCPIISANGGRIDAHCRESLLFEDCIEYETSKRVCERLISDGCFMTSYVGTEVYSLPETNGYHSTCIKISEAAKTGTVDIEAQRRLLREKGTVNPYKYEAYSDDRQLLDKLKCEFTAMGLSVSGAFAFNIEIMAPGAGKGRATEYLSKKLNIPKEEIMALGDGSNDITLLNASGFPVAMRDAADSLKAQATLIAPSAMDDGAAQVIEEYILSEKNV